MNTTHMMLVTEFMLEAGADSILCRINMEPCTWRMTVAWTWFGYRGGSN